MIDKKIHLDLICRERDSLRQELIEMEKAMHKTVFVFLTACVAFVGLYLNENIVKDPNTRNLLLLGLSQVEFSCWLFVACLMTNQNVHVGYISALEDRINEICECPMSLWDSHVTRRFIGSPRGAFFWATLVLVLFSFIIFVLCNVVVLKQLQSGWLAFILLFEVLVVFALLLAGLREPNRVQNFSNDLFKKSIGELKRR